MEGPWRRKQVLERQIDEVMCRGYIKYRGEQAPTPLVSNLDL